MVAILNRREFISRLPCLAVMGVTLPTKKMPDYPDHLVCRWYESSHGQWELRIGKANELEALGTYGSTLEGTLWTYSYLDPTRYSFRFGRLFHEFSAASIADAKKLAEYQLVEWLRQLTVQVERLAFA